MAGGRVEVHVHAPDLVAAELDVARTGAVVAGRLAGSADPRDHVVGDGARGVPNGIAHLMFTSSRTPRSRRYSSNRRAASLGAGGHLNGAPQTPTIAVPVLNVGSTSRMLSAPATV